MSAVTRPRGPLPRRVYWTRRLLVVLLAAGLVVGIAHLLGGGPGHETASPVSATPTAGSSSLGAATSSAGPTPASRPGSGAGAGTGAPHGSSGQARPALARPEGPCDAADVIVTPRLPDPHAGEPVEIDLELTTTNAAACTWQVTPESVFVTIDSAAERIWSSQQCPGVIPTQDVVPRREKPDVVRFSWNAKESDEGCTSATDWVLPGVYTATAVARGSVTPVDVGFRLGPAVRPTVTETPTESPNVTPTDTRTGTATPTPSVASTPAAASTPTPTSEPAPSAEEAAPAGAPTGSSTPTGSPAG